MRVTPRAALGLAVLAGCGRLAFDPRDDGGASDDGTTDAAPCTGPFGNVQEATWLSTGTLEWAPHESRDGLTLYFGRDLGGGDTEILRSTRATRNNAWGAPVPIPGLTGAGDQEDNPAPSGDELEMYFGRTFTERVARADRSQPWGGRTTVLMDGALFSGAQGPFLSADGLSLYFCGITGAGYDLFVVTRPTLSDSFATATPIALDTLNTSGDDGWPYVSDDELTIYFTSVRSGNLDTWMATRPNKQSPFGQVTPVDPVNSLMDEYDPNISADGTTLWFASNRNGGSFQYDIFFATRTCP